MEEWVQRHKIPLWPVKGCVCVCASARGSMTRGNAICRYLYLGEQLTGLGLLCGLIATLWFSSLYICLSGPPWPT